MQAFLSRRVAYLAVALASLSSEVLPRESSLYQARTFGKECGETLLHAPWRYARRYRAHHEGPSGVSTVSSRCSSDRTSGCWNCRRTLTAKNSS